MRRYWFLVLVSALLPMAGAIAVALHRSPTYTASAEDVVQALAPNIVQLPGAVQAAQDLASNQSRLIDSVGVTGPLARRFGVSISSIASNLSATSIPSSTVIRIDAQSDSADGAIRLVNAAAREFALYVNAATKTDSEARRLLNDFEAASAAYARAVAARQSVQPPGRPPTSAAVVATSAAVDAAQLRRQALGSQYQNLVQSQASAPQVEPFVSARRASSNRRSDVQIFGFAGAIAGLLIGAALAMLLANRRSRRVIA